MTTIYSSIKTLIYKILDLVRNKASRQPLLMLFVFFILGIVVWGGFNTVLEHTNRLEFCISCHEMKDNVYQEYKQTIHFSNRTGVNAGCPDCHVPKEWKQMLIRKIKASRELFYKVTGSIDTPKKFEHKRLELAKRVWASMQSRDSIECRNCHHFKSMNLELQKSRSTQVHQFAQQRGKTCIDCHKGIAHHLPKGIVVERGGSNEDHKYYETKKVACYLCHAEMPKPIEEDWGF